jgi:alpha-D-ribose 1-methylphosphonate 5-triphosphate diphosphatase PhnM
MDNTSKDEIPHTDLASAVTRKMLQSIIVLVSLMLHVPGARLARGAVHTRCYFPQSLTPGRNRRRVFPVR